MFLVENEKDFLDKYGEMAYKIAGRFVIEAYRDIERRYKPTCFIVPMGSN